MMALELVLAREAARSRGREVANCVLWCYSYRFYNGTSSCVIARQLEWRDVLARLNRIGKPAPKMDWCVGHADLFCLNMPCLRYVYCVLCGW